MRSLAAACVLEFWTRSSHWKHHGLGFLLVATKKTQNPKHCRQPAATLYSFCIIASTSKDEGFERLHGQLHCVQCKNYLPGFIKGTCACQRSRVPCFSLYCSSPASFASLFFAGFTCRMNPFCMDTCMDGWQSCRLCWAITADLFVRSWDNVGQLPWRLELGLIFILRVDLWVWTAWKAPRGNFFCHLPLSSEYSVFSECMCAFLYKHCRFSGTALGRSAVGDMCSFFL